MMTYLVLIRGSHILDNLLALGLGDAPLLRNDLRKHAVHLPSHVRGVTAHVEVRLLLEQLVYFLGAFLEAVLDVDLLRPFSRERGNQFELVAEDLLVFLRRSLVLR